MNHKTSRQRRHPCTANPGKRSKRWNFEDAAAAPPPTLIQGVPFSGRQKLFDFKRDDCQQPPSQ